MKIIIINGSHRKNGATALILRKMHQKLKTFPDIEIQFYHIADLNLFLMMTLKNYQKISKQRTELS